MKNILVSNCILGNNCKYNGKNNYNPLIERLKEKYRIIPICPEVMGGLSIPRKPSEINANKVFDIDGNDVTSYFNRGKDLVLDIISKNDIEFVVLKDGSPSCGSKFIYDGTFTKTKISGMGITAKKINELGIKIYTENEINELL